MEMPKPTEADKARFRSLVGNLPGVEAKPMFGNLGAFVNGNMFAGLFGADIGVKLPESDRHAVLALGGRPFGPAERPMSGYVTLPAGCSTTQIREWISSSLAFVAAMPPKKPKPKKSS